MIMAAMFHRRCGERVTLTNGNRTAIRNFSEFNCGLVLSSEPLVDNQLFEVRIDKKINSWSGSIEIGVTTCDPDTMEFPSSATDLRDGSWIMSGNSILKDGRSVLEIYGSDLDKLLEGDRIGVMRTAEGELVFYLNSVCQGVAAEGIPSRVFAVVDMYGKCAQVSIVSPGASPQPDRSESEAEINNDRATTTSTTDLVASLSVNVSVGERHNNEAVDRLRFHERCGSLVKLSGGGRAAERRRPLDEFNNGVVMTHRPLRDNELFEIRIDRLVDKWSGSIEVGVTTHNPTALEFPATMTNMRSGTTMMSGCGILTNGKGTRREYGMYNLDELKEGDRIGMMRKLNGDLHYFINGLDQGVAATKIPYCVWGVVDLYGMTVKVTIVDRDEREEQNLITRRNTALRDQQLMQSLNDMPEEDCVDRLMFHSHCGTHAAVIFNNRTAHRPNAMDDFNNGVVLTNRPLKPGELFEVRLDKMVVKWAGSIEIGVTTHHPTELEYPSTMTNVRSGTWMMTGNGVMHNGTTVIDDYGQNLDRLQVGDRVGVMCKEGGTLHFFVNGVDQGCAATNIPESVYGVIDLYGQAAQATIVDSLDCYSPDTANSSLSNNALYSDLRFHHVHGKNARVSNNFLTASRPRAFGEFNDAIVMSNRALREGEMFEVVIDKTVDRWSGSIEAGVTAIRPEDLDFPSTMTDIGHDTWMLSGSSVMQDGITLRNGYACDLDTLTAGTRIGMMRHEDATLHYYIDGVDQGTACEGVPRHVHAVVDLYGQCAQVSIVPQGAERRDAGALAGGVPSENSSQPLSLPALLPGHATCDAVHRFSACCGKNVALRSGNTVATRVRNYSHALAFSQAPLEPDEVFEVCIQEVALQWSGTLHVGVTTLPVSDACPPGNLPPLIAGLAADTWFLTGSEVRRNTTMLKVNYCPSLEWLVVGSKVGVKRCGDGSLHFLFNGEDMGVAATGLPKRVFAVVDLYGSTVSVGTSSARPAASQEGGGEGVAAVMVESARSSKLHDSLEMLLDTTPTNKTLVDDIPPLPSSKSCELRLEDGGTGRGGSPPAAPPQPLVFHEYHGRNVGLGEGRLSARRIASYNQGVVISGRPLPRDQLFQVRIEALNPRWMSSLMCGVVSVSPDKTHFPLTALGFKRNSWIVCSDCIYQNGIKVRNGYGPNLDHLQVSHIVGVLVDGESQLHLFVNGVDQGVAAKDIPPLCYAVVDLYGQCEEVSVVLSGEDGQNAAPEVSAASEAECLSEKADLECDEKEKLASSPPAPPPSLALYAKSPGGGGGGGLQPCSSVHCDSNVEVISNATPVGSPAGPGTPGGTVSKNCEYLGACTSFKNALGIPDGFFLREHSVCYCETCHKLRGAQAYNRKGDPPAEYAVPCGWCRFTLRRPPGADAASDRWHVAFYGSRLADVRTILDHGQLLLPGELGLERTTYTKDKSKEDDSDGSQLLFSPSLKYAAATTVTNKYEYVDPKTKRRYQARAAFQILAQPGSYKVGPPSLPGIAKPVDPHLDHDTAEWVTKERGATVLCALLVRLEAL
ncbi:neuralized-like protein 4 [Bacillus rossius redtenbacheri]|uniref:neuralized-like protein 4 n=1 Tax=Bacillus rossius redtenbacheri TaxID=93214 RepID=UPI002FDCD0AD